MAALVQGRQEPPVVIDRNWPSYRYPPGGDPASGKLFSSEADVPVGWLDAPSVPAPPPPPPVSRAKPPPREDESRWRREAVENAQRLVAAEADLATVVARVGELEAFIAKLAAEENCPAPLKRACNMLVPSTEPEAAAPEAPAKKSRAKAKDE